MAQGGTLDGMLQVKARGLVRNVGYGMRQPEFHPKAIATGDVDFLLCFNNYNLIRQSTAEDLLPEATAADVGVMNGWSILGGLLTGIDIDEARERGATRTTPMSTWRGASGNGVATKRSIYCNWRSNSA
ncbi:MAG: hypothetical protein R2867_41380 [Caldilineaceae bacterium]